MAPMAARAMVVMMLIRCSLLAIISGMGNSTSNATTTRVVLRASGSV